MTFFNKKEEVINIQLTQYGKYLLSKGNFKPVYYEFFDDDIIYDNRYANSEESEKQKDIQIRIKEVPRTQTQHTFVGAEETLKKQVQLIRNKQNTSNDIYIPYAIKHTAKSVPLGRSEIGEQKKAAWNIKMLNGTFSDTKTFITGSYSNLNYPRLTVTPTDFKVRTRQNDETTIFVPGDLTDTVSETGFTPTADLNKLSTRFADNSYLEVQDDYLLIDLQEMNVPYEQENFEIELYSIEEDEAGQEVLKQLFFNKKKQSVVNNILTEIQESITDYVPNSTDMAETYFNIQTDREINSNILCHKLTDEEKATLVATNQLDLNCQESYSNLQNPRLTSDIIDVGIVGDKC